MIDKGQWRGFGQDTGVTPLLYTKNGMGLLMTTEIQDLGLTSHPKDLNGCGIQGDFFAGAWQWKTSDVILMKIFGLTKKSDRMSTKNHQNFFNGCYFVVILYFCVFVVT